MVTHTTNSTRLNSTLESLGRIGESPSGMQRVAFSPEDVAGRTYVMDLMQRAGLQVRIDPAGNIIGRRPGTDSRLRPIGLGSHADSVPNGGKYDGALGVLSAIEVVETLNDLGMVTGHPLEVLVFTNEEGTRFNRWLLGSRAMAGLWEDGDYQAVDADGVGIAQHLRAIGGDLDRVSEAVRRQGDLHAYLELHIEQGPTLHRTGTPVGVVSGITGRAVYQVLVTGFANHAGTTPMDARKDALLAASKLIVAVNTIATEEEVCRAGTVGAMKVNSDTINIIPGQVELGMEFRDVDIDRMREAERRFRQVAGELADVSGVDIQIDEIEMGPPCPVEIGIQEVVAEAASSLGLAYRSLPSGAGHDAQAMAAITRSGMIFVPSVDGISHSPHEYTSPEDCANGASVLLNAMLLLDRG
jgi:N-carbamoyl-L-amino-acid hydrolase